MKHILTRALVASMALAVPAAAYAASAHPLDATQGESKDKKKDSKKKAGDKSPEKKKEGDKK